MSRHRNMCPTPHKHRYRNKLDAKIALALVSGKRRSSRAETRYYRCPCGWVHLTSKDVRR